MSDLQEILAFLKETIESLEKRMSRLEALVFSILVTLLSAILSGFIYVISVVATK